MSGNSLILHNRNKRCGRWQVIKGDAEAGLRGYAKNDDGVPFFTLETQPSLFLYVALGAIVVGTLSALFPAQRAARLDPAVAIRG